jgi:hypothetical protein
MGITGDLLRNQPYLTGYDTELFQDDLGLLCVRVSGTLSEMGVEPPKAFPPELDPYFNSDDGSGNDEADDNDPELLTALRVT